MKAFNNLTNQGNEPAVKKGSKLPSNAVNLGWFSSDEITPEMHLSVSDISYSIPENNVPVTASEVDSIMYADEFGVLRYVRANNQMGQQFGSPIVNNSEVSITNYLMEQKEDDLEFNYTGRIDELEEEFFVHSFYVSTHFCLLDSNVANYYGIEKSSRLREPSTFAIKVVDQSGNNIIDTNGNDKYKIVLEKYTNNRSLVELYGTKYEGLDLYRIIVLLEEANPQNLYLMYNKYEKTEDNIPYNPFFGYKEKINAIPYYNYVVEESEVVDPSSQQRKVYSTQLFSYKENELLKNRISNDGWKVYVPRKAIQDPRTFQSFNWRLLAKISYDYANVRNVYADSERATLNVGVIYSGDINQAKNAYVFHNMEESVFNLQNYLFQNPLAGSNTSKNQKNYWLVNIDDLTVDFSQFDILAWTPTQNITELQGVAIGKALDANVSVFVDISAITSGLNYLNIDLSLTTTSSGYMSIHDTYKNGNQTLNAWDLSEYSESSQYLSYSIFGKRKEILNNNSLIPIRTFSGTPSGSATTVVSVGTNAAVIKIPTNSFSSGLVVSSNPFLYYINDIVKADGSSTPNNGESNSFPLGSVGSQTSSISNTSVGPNKFFYNFLSDVNKNKVNNYATNNTSNQSTVLWNVSPWRNWWTINGAANDGKITVLSEAEKVEYNFSLKAPINSTDQQFCRQVVPSISNVLLSDFEGTLNGQDAESIINADYSNVEFYIECTNPNVKFLNFTKYDGSDTLLNQSSSTYSIFKLDSTALNQIRNTAVSLDAYSSVLSKEFDFSSIAYPYAILNASEYHDKTGSLIKTPKDFLPGSQDVRNYSFGFKTNISINEITKTQNTYRVNWSTDFSSVINGEADFRNILFKQGRSEGGITESDFSISEVEENKIQIKQKFSPFNKYYYPGKVFSKTDIVSADQETTASSFNNFHYTGDIDAGNRWDEYFVGKDSFGATGSTTTSTSSSSPAVTVTTTTKTTKGSPLSSAKIKAEIISASQSDGTFDTTSGNHGDPIGYWATLVWNGSEAISLSIYFHRWLERFFQSKIPNGTSAQYFAYYAGAPASWIADQFIAQNPLVYSAEEKVTSGGGTAGKVTVASVSTTTTVVKTTTRNGYSAEFVKYVQYTLSKMGYKVTINGLYDSSTGSNIRLFQHSAGLGFVDGIVDSQTKSVLATYWLYLFKNNITKYNSFVQDAPTGSAKYIRAAIKYSDISNIGVAGREYRRISFTGVPGPTEIEDYIFFKIPTKAADQLLHSVTISTGEWGAKIGEVEVFASDLDLIKFYQRTKERVSIPGTWPAYIAGYGSIAANSSKKITFGSTVSGAKWVGIRFYSKKIKDTKFGPNAEGFSIKDVKFGISSPSTDIPPVYGGTSRFQGNAQGTISGYTDIKASDESIIDFTTIQNMLAMQVATSITSINLEKISISATQKVDDITKSINITHDISPSEKLRYNSSTNKLSEQYSFTYGDVAIKIDGLDQTNSLYGISPSIDECYTLSATSSPSSVSSSSFSLSQVSGRENVYMLKTTLGILFDSKETSSSTTVSDYYIADADNISSRQNTKLTINVRDGIVVLTDSAGRPIGFPNFVSYAPSSVNSVVNFGFLNLTWNYEQPSPYGLEWGFYNIATKKFLGKKISYAEYMQYGPNNIFIGLNAFDADMDRGTGDNIIGTTVRMPQSEANRPTRYICPLYSVKVKNRSKIRVSAPPKTLSKFDTWFINIGVGKFIKNITIPLDYQFSNWMKDYKGKTLKCYYDTTQIKTPSSSIFGQGYYDVHDEHPVVVSDNTITLRYGSVHSVQEQYDKQMYINGDYTDASPVVPWVFVSIKNSKGKWISISRKEIKDFDKYTGRITFKKEIVPLSSSDIKVSYTIKNQDLMMHQIDGEIIPLNPFLGINNNKPLFLYLLPIRCEELVDGSYSTASGFVSSGPIKFTNDSAIFDSRSTKYNPLALHIATVAVNNLYDFDKVKLEDMRIKGGGVKHSTNISKEFESNIEIASYADVYTGFSFLHPNGGYVIIQIPQEVISNFTSRQDIYSIVRNNLTAGVSFDIQDVDGNDWRSIINVE